MFPSDALPVHAVFVRNRLQALARHVDLRVTSPVPVFPLATRWMGRYQVRLRVPTEQVHPASDGSSAPPLFARYPRFLSIPGILKPSDGLFLAAIIRREVEHHRRYEGFAPDLIDAHLAYPDGYAAVRVAQALDLPVTITLRGHDINDFHRFPVRWRQVLHGLRHATRIFGVCQALLDKAIEAGVAPADTVPLTNGVNLDHFGPMPQTEARAGLELPLDRRIVLSVGHMVPRKGFHVLVDALRRMHAAGEKDVLMVFVGAGGEEGDYSAEIRRLVAQAGLVDSVRFAGAVPNHELRRYYAAADLFALASDKEGWANVLFESLACGTPVVATRVWGTAECICRPTYGRLVDDRDGTSFAAALSGALATPWDTQALVRYARANTWSDVGQRVAIELLRAYGRHHGRSHAELRTLLGPPPRGAHVPDESESSD